jgi:hypothetical protein
MIVRNGIPEKDWKIIRDMKGDLVRKAIDRVFLQVEEIARHRKADPEKAYSELWEALKQRDSQIGLMFDDLKRSNAKWKIMEMVNNGLLSPKELDVFTEETREWVQVVGGANQCVQRTHSRVTPRAGHGSRHTARR